MNLLLLDKRATSLGEALLHSSAPTHTTLGVRRRDDAKLTAQLHKFLTEAGEAR